MKKIFCFSLIVMFLALAGLTPVRADDIAVVTPFVESPTLTNEQITNLENASLLLEYLRKGGTIDVKNTSSDYDADDLLNDFGNFVRDVVGEIVDVVNPFQTEIEYHGLQPIRPAKPAIFQFMGLLPFYALNSQDDEPVPTPDVNYLTYLDKINGSGFWFKDFPNKQGNSNYIGLQYYPPNSVTWCVYQGNAFDFDTCYPYCIPIYDVNIFSVDGVYYFNTTISNSDLLRQFGEYGTYFYKQGVLYHNGFNYNGDYPNIWNANYSGTLAGCLDLVSQHFRNVNIYVDGVLWSYVGGEQTNYQIEISTGTTVPIKDGTGKVEWLYDYEIFFDIDRIQDDLNSILHLIRDNPQTPTIIKFDDLEDVIVDVDGQPAVAVKVLADTRNIDEIYIENYGPIIPAFLPLFTPVIDDVDIIAIADTAVSPIPDDLLEVFGYMFMGVLFVGFIHRLLE